MTQYLLAVHGPEEQYDTPLEDMQASFEATGRFNDKIMAAGHWVFGGGLERPSSATVVDNTEGKNVVTDGPYLEAKEHIGGFWVIEAQDLDAALALAAEASAGLPGHASRCARSSPSPRADRPRARSGHVRDRAGVPLRVRTSGGDPGPLLRRHRPRRGSGPGRLRGGAPALARGGPPALPRRLDHHDGPPPRDRPDPPRVHAGRPPGPGHAAQRTRRTP